LRKVDPAEAVKLAASYSVTLASNQNVYVATAPFQLPPVTNPPTVIFEEPASYITGGWLGSTTVYRPADGGVLQDGACQGIWRGDDVETLDRLPADYLELYRTCRST
jgi:hypothetical protein